MHWRIKGILQKALSTIPGGIKVNDILQQTIGGLRSFDHHVQAKTEDWLILTNHMREVGIDIKGSRLVEIGTGWIPVFPVCFSLAGADSCTTFDLVKHLNLRMTIRMLKQLECVLEDISRASDRSQSEVIKEYNLLKDASSVDEILKLARIKYFAPADATDTCFDEKCVDVVFSNSVLEHVPPKVIEKIMQEGRRILRKGGVSIHSVNCGDHYAYFDSKISANHYLGYTAKQWEFWNNEIQYQNRMRPIDFVRIAETSGMEIVIRRSRPRKKLLEILPYTKIDPEFQCYPPEELCSTSIDFVARNT